MYEPLLSPSPFALHQFPIGLHRLHDVDGGEERELLRDQVGKGDQVGAGGGIPGQHQQLRSVVLHMITHLSV